MERDLNLARSDLLLSLVRSGARGDQVLFKKALEALVAEERGKQHHVLADQLELHLRQNGGITQAPEGPVRRSDAGMDLFFGLEPHRHLDDLILPVGVKNSCRELVEEQHRADLLRAHNVEPRHRILVAGPPGNGKTSLAEALATELSCRLLVVKYESVIASYLGETALRLSKLFEQARLQRCVLFFDEFDVVGKERGDVHETGEIKRAVSSLLLQVDALPSYVVVVAATNHPELLDRAVWRRFQLRLNLPAPSESQVQEWLRNFEARLGHKIGISAVSKKLHVESFAELEQFGLDIQRRYILAQSSGDLKRITGERLTQWENRFSSAKK